MESYRPMSVEPNRKSFAQSDELLNVVRCGGKLGFHQPIVKSQVTFDLQRIFTVLIALCLVATVKAQVVGADAGGALSTRSFHFNERLISEVSVSSAGTAQERIREFLKTAGVEFPTNKVDVT